MHKRPHIDPTSTSHRPHIDLTSTYIDLASILIRKNINVSKHFILGHLCSNIPPVKMPYKHKRDCPVCDKPGLLYMSDHLRQVLVHHLYGDEKKKWLGRARFSISHKHCSGSLPGCPTHTVEEMRCVRKITCSVRQPTKAARKVTASMLTKPCPEFIFRHKFSLLVVGPTQSGKTYFVQQILWLKRQTVLWYLDCLRKAAIETPALFYCCKTCFLRGNIIQISAEMPSTWLSAEVLAIENKSELLQNVCLTRIECTL